MISKYLNYIQESAESKLVISKEKYDETMKKVKSRCDTYDGARKDACIFTEKIRALRFYFKEVDKAKKECKSKICVEKIEARKDLIEKLIKSSQEQLYKARDTNV